MIKPCRNGDVGDVGQEGGGDHQFNWEEALEFCGQGLSAWRVLRSDNYSSLFQNLRIRSSDQFILVLDMGSV